ncbi:hypothetical protein ZWY2020_033593 [Hordeum vulgare]|nr:hypothetical protein ZWY2020_033593 [Hordeum vulgare]
MDLGEALWPHDDWLKASRVVAGNKRSVRLAVLVWGDSDYRTKLEFEFRFKGIENPSYFDQWINLRIPFQAALRGEVRANLQEAVRAVGLYSEGRLHRGLDDALNTARLLCEIMDARQANHHRLAAAASVDPAEAAASHKHLWWHICVGAATSADPPAAGSHRNLQWLECTAVGMDPTESATVATSSDDKTMWWLLCNVLLVQRGGD